MDWWLWIDIWSPVTVTSRSNSENEEGNEEQDLKPDLMNECSHIPYFHGKWCLLSNKNHNSHDPTLQLHLTFHINVPLWWMSQASGICHISDVHCIATCWPGAPVSCLLGYFFYIFNISNTIDICPQSKLEISKTWQGYWQGKWPPIVCEEASFNLAAR